jgi:hypothetical protein
MLISGGGFTNTYLLPPLWLMRNPSVIEPMNKMPE